MSCLSIIVLVTLITVLSINFCDLGEFAAIHTEPFDDMIFAVGDEYFQGLGTLAFAFSCQQYSFHAFETLDDLPPPPSRYTSVTPPRYPKVECEDSSGDRVWWEVSSV